MIASTNGVMSTSDESIQHQAWWTERDGWENCTTPAPMHYDAEGELMSCQEATKMAGSMLGARILKRRKFPIPTGPQMPLNLPR